MTGDWSFWYCESCKHEIVNMQLQQLPIFNKLKKISKREIYRPAVTIGFVSLQGSVEDKKSMTMKLH